MYLGPANWTQFGWCQSGWQHPKHAGQGLVPGHPLSMRPRGRVDLEQTALSCFTACLIWCWSPLLASTNTTRELPSIFSILVSVVGELDEAVVWKLFLCRGLYQGCVGCSCRPRVLRPREERDWISVAVNTFQHRLLDLQRQLWLWFCRGGVWRQGFPSSLSTPSWKESLSPRCFIPFRISCPEHSGQK